MANRKRTVLDLSLDQRLDLEAFCKVFFGANMSEVIRRSIDEFIETQLQETNRREEFDRARRRLAGGDEPIRLVDGEKRKAASASD
jgi:hypothetical protein